MRNLQECVGPDDDDSQVAVHGDLIAGVNQDRCVRDSRHARQAVLSGNDGPVDEHPAPALHNARAQGNDKGHGGIDGVTDKDFPRLEVG